MQKKRSLTLIEVLCAFVLMTMLASLLFIYFRHQIHLKSDIAVRKSKALERSKLQSRLMRCFNQLKKEPFYTQDGALFFTFDGGIDRDPDFCHAVKGKVYVDGDQLLLRVMPLKGEKFREHILMRKVESYSLTFRERDKKPRFEWPSKEPHPPSFLFLEVNGASFAFFFPREEALS